MENVSSKRLIYYTDSFHLLNCSPAFNIQIVYIWYKDEQVWLWLHNIHEIKRRFLNIAVIPFYYFNLFFLINIL